MSVHRSRKARSPRAAAKGVAFYDVDGTLIDLNLVHVALYMLANLGEWSGRLRYIASFAARAPRMYRAEQRDRRLFNAVLFEMFKGLSRDRLETVGEEYCDRILMKHLYPHGVELLAANRDAGLEPVLVTGSPDFIVAPLAARLGIRDFAANRLVYSAGIATGRLRAPIMSGDEKAEWCVSYARERSLDLAGCWGYADSYYDLPFLAAMGHPVAVNPDRRLAATARGRQWLTIRFARERNTSTIFPETAGGAVASWTRGFNGAS